MKEERRGTLWRTTFSSLSSRKAHGRSGSCYATSHFTVMSDGARGSGIRGGEKGGRGKEGKEKGRGKSRGEDRKGGEGEK